MTSVANGRTIPTAPGRLPLLGHARAFRRDPIAFLSRMRALGDVVRIHLGPKAAYVVNDEELIRQIFVTDARRFDKGVFWEKVGAIIGNGLANSAGAVHLRQRRLMQPAFHRERIAHYTDAVGRYWHDRMSTWDDRPVVSVPDEMADVALAIVIRTVFSARIGADAVETIQRHFPGVQAGIMWRTLNPFPLLEKLPTPGNHRFARRIGEIWTAVDRTIAAYRRADAEHDDLLAMLINARDDDGRPMTDTEIRDQVLTIALAAGDTTANALSWSCYRLGRHPEVARRIAEEVARVAGDRPLGAADLDRLTYTDRVVREIFRLYPFWMLMRRTTEEVALHNGVRLPAGAQVLISPIALHRDPAVFPHPLAFDPDRWLPERAGEIRRTSYIPFGAGARQCIGDRFAWMEVMLGVATICRRFDLRPVHGQSTEEVCRISVNPSALRMTPHRRTPATAPMP